MFSLIYRYIFSTWPTERHKNCNETEWGKMESRDRSDNLHELSATAYKAETPHIPVFGVCTAFRGQELKRLGELHNLWGVWRERNHRRPQKWHTGRRKDRQTCAHTVYTDKHTHTQQDSTERKKRTGDSMSSSNWTEQRSHLSNVWARCMIFLTIFSRSVCSSNRSLTTSRRAWTPVTKTNYWQSSLLSKPQAVANPI